METAPGSKRRREEHRHHYCHRPEVWCTTAPMSPTGIATHTPIVITLDIHAGRMHTDIMRVTHRDLENAVSSDTPSVVMLALRFYRECIERRPHVWSDDRASTYPHMLIRPCVAIRVAHAFVRAIGESDPFMLIRIRVRHMRAHGAVLGSTGLQWLRDAIDYTPPDDGATITAVACIDCRPESESAFVVCTASLAGVRSLNYMTWRAMDHIDIRVRLSVNDQGMPEITMVRWNPPCCMCTQ